MVKIEVRIIKISSMIDERTKHAAWSRLQEAVKDSRTTGEHILASSNLVSFNHTNKNNRFFIVVLYLSNAITRSYILPDPNLLNLRLIPSPYSYVSSVIRKSSPISFIVQRVNCN